VNVQAFCTSAKVDALAAICSSTDTLMAALYVAAGSLGADTTGYSTTNEVVGMGYTAGGIEVTNVVGADSANGVAFWTPSAPLVYPSVTLTVVDTVLIYNESQGGRAIAVFNFGTQSIIEGTFTLTMPPNDDVTGLVRIG
jgi:hypothetical protein